MIRKYMIFLLAAVMTLSPAAAFAETAAGNGADADKQAEQVIVSDAEAAEAADAASDEAASDNAEEVSTAGDDASKAASDGDAAEAAAEESADAAQAENQDTAEAAVQDEAAAQEVPAEPELVQSEARNEGEAATEDHWNAAGTQYLHADGTPYTGLFIAKVNGTGPAVLFYADAQGNVVKKTGPVAVSSGTIYTYNAAQGAFAENTTLMAPVTYFITYDQTNACYCVEGKEGIYAADGSNYYVMNDGTVQTTPGFITATDGSRYFIPAADGKMRTAEGLFTFSGKTYYSDADGKVNTKKGIVTAADGSKYYAGSDGAIRTNEGFVYPTGKNGKKYYVQTGGKIMTDGQVLTRGRYKYVVKPGGAIRTKVGFTTLDGGTKRYYVKKTSGIIYFNKSFKVKGKTYHASPTGELYTGVHKWKSNYYYASSKGTIRTKQGIVEDASGKRYYVKKGGKIAANKKITYKGKTHIASKNGNFYIGIFTWKGDLYYSSDEGVVKTSRGIVKSGGKRYFVQSGGKIAKNKKSQYKGKTYISNKKGVIRKGLFTWKGNLYYASSKGVLKTSEGVINIDGDMYFVQSGGIIAKDKKTSHNGKYYISGSDGIIRTGLFTWNSNMYYADNDGVLYTSEGVITVSGKRYFVKKGGAIAKDKKSSHNGKYYISNTNGVIITGGFFNWHSNLYYAGSDGALKTSTVFDTNGHKYAARKTGVIARNRKSKINNKYYISNSDAHVITGGFFNWSGNQYYAGNDGVLKSAEIFTVNGNRYAASKGGAIAKNKKVKINGNYYITKDTGIVHTQFFNWNGDLYFANDNGVLRSTAGVFTAYGNKYYSRKGGKIYVNTEFRTGGNLYRADKNGRLLTGKYTWGGNDYIADANGAVRTEEGLAKYGSDKYYVTKGGPLAKSTFVTDNGKHYYVGKSGAVVKSSFTYNGVTINPDVGTGEISAEEYAKAFPDTAPASDDQAA